MKPKEKSADWEKLGNLPPTPSFAPGFVSVLRTEPWRDMSELFDKLGNFLFQLKAIDNIHDARIEFRNQGTLKNAIADENFSVLFLETQIVTRSLVVWAVEEGRPNGDRARSKRQEVVFVAVNPLWAYRDYSALRASIDHLFRRQSSTHGLLSVGYRLKISDFLDARINEETPAWKVLQEENRHKDEKTSKASSEER